jgi:hypothetical protein
MLACFAVLVAPAVSLRLPQSPSRGQNEQSTFHSPYALPSSVSRKSCACHSYRNCRCVREEFPFWFNPRRSRHLPFSTRQNIQVLSFPTLAHSLARRKHQLPCFQPFPNSLPQNTRGWGHLQSDISQAKLSQIQSPGSLWHAAIPHALWAQDQTGSSEVRE